MPDIQSGDILPPTEDEARSESIRIMETESRYFKSTESMLTAADALAKSLTYASHRQVHTALGMSWSDWVAKFAPKLHDSRYVYQRRTLELLLYRQGSSQRAIADLLGVSHAIVNRDIQILESEDNDDAQVFTNVNTSTTEKENSLPSPTTTGRDGKQYNRSKSSRRQVTSRIGKLTTGPSEPPLSDHRHHATAARADAAVTERKQASQRPELSQSQHQHRRAFKAGITALEKLQADPAYMDSHGDTLASELQLLHGKLGQWLLARDTESRMHNESLPSPNGNSK